MNSQAIQIAAFYHFQTVPADQVERLAEQLETMGREHGLMGLIIFATEGMNGTISGLTREAVVTYLDEACKLLGFPKMDPKWSEAPSWPFRRFKVAIREEIVTLGKPEVQPLTPKSPTHLSPDEWNRVLEEEDCVVLDTRNWYETRIGTFKNAIDPKLNEFNEFSDYVKQADLPKDKKVLIFCTGGIRCEKAIVEMNQQGFDNVYQLDGGILNYLAQHPNRNFDGECFVFDHRVAVDQELKPSAQYKLCPHCGQPAEQKINCAHCDVEAVVCVTCIADADKQTCSKNCAHHHRLNPSKKGRGQGVNYRFKQPTTERSHKSKP
ncbi:MAG TPA: rhodanese-like domain-containing protein [Bdellovibrionales bacterium]|nr:rhodanese-like domain-containing protein [Bdellovibrionales bacterium]